MHSKNGRPVGDLNRYRLAGLYPHSRYFARRGQIGKCVKAVIVTDKKRRSVSNMSYPTGIYDQAPANHCRPANLGIGVHDRNPVYAGNKAGRYGKADKELNAYRIRELAGNVNRFVMAVMDNRFSGGAGTCVKTT
ncbi:unnamed protein product [marine sediment metagenome]|uniref:Uncharacterized protein n=1 Tax=marine sediment metagenome TaxID=412755 RepID=X1JNA6_9ZZZZ